MVQLSIVMSKNQLDILSTESCCFYAKVDLHRVSSRVHCAAISVGRVHDFCPA
jgi:hypothetical protein